MVTQALIDQTVNWIGRVHTSSLSTHFFRHFDIPVHTNGVMA